MKIYNDFDEEIYKDIAKNTGVKQTEKDIGYAKFVYYHNPEKRYSERIDQDAWILGCINKNNFRIIGMTMKDYLHYLWNNPKMGQSPYKIFERVLVPNGYDENKDIIYKYNQDVTFEQQQDLSRNEILETRM